MFVDDVYEQHLSACLFADEQVYRRFESAWTKTEAINSTLRVRLWIDVSALVLHTLHWETVADCFFQGKRYAQKAHRST